MRDIEVHQRHPRLRPRRRALVTALRHLDVAFFATPADLPHLTPAARRRAAKGPGGLVPPGELSIAFVTDPAIARLHADYLDDPTATDVITFEGTPEAGLAGEICVSVDTAAAYAAARGLPFAEELLRYVVHGWLHLAGYDDLVPAKKRRMRAAEDRALRLLRAEGLIPDFSLRGKP